MLLFFVILFFVHEGVVWCTRECAHAGEWTCVCIYSYTYVRDGERRACGRTGGFSFVGVFQAVGRRERQRAKKGWGGEHVGEYLFQRDVLTAFKRV